MQAGAFDSLAWGLNPDTEVKNAPFGAGCVVTWQCKPTNTHDHAPNKHATLHPVSNSRRLLLHITFKPVTPFGGLVSLFEFLNVFKLDEVLGRLMPFTFRSHASSCFLREIAQSDHTSVHVVIQDEAGFHLKTGDARAPENVRLLPLPPYGPGLNPTARVG